MWYQSSDSSQTNSQQRVKTYFYIMKIIISSFSTIIVILWETVWRSGNRELLSCLNYFFVRICLSFWIDKVWKIWDSNKFSNTLSWIVTIVFSSFLVNNDFSKVICTSIWSYQQSKLCEFVQVDFRMTSAGWINFCPQKRNSIPKFQ